MEEIKRELELATLPEMPKRLDYRIGVIIEKPVLIRLPLLRWIRNKVKK